MKTIYSKIKLALLAVVLQFSISVVINAQPCNLSVVGSPVGGSYTWNFWAFDSLNCLSPSVNYTYTWIFGDNSAPGSGQQVQHTYNATGIYNVCLEVMGGGLQISQCISITVGTPPTDIWIGGLIETVPGTCFQELTQVEIIGIDSPSYQTVTINGIADSCYYFFSVVPNKQYVIRATPSGSLYLPTYYGNVPFWSEATVIQPAVHAGNLNIQLQTSLWSTIGTGNGTVSGTVSGNGTLITTNFNGNPITTTFNVQRSHAIILNSANQPIGFANLDANGNFSFPNLPVGQYFLRIESPKVNSATFPVTISAAQPNTFVSVVATGSGINLVTANSKLMKAAEIDIFPNPATQFITVSGSFGKIEIIDAQGQKVLESSDSQLNIQKLPVGIYTIKTKNAAKETITTRFIKN